MRNQDCQITLDYHEATKHSRWSVRANPHFLDWSNQPRPFKIYRDLKPIALPAIAAQSERPLLSVLPEIDVPDPEKSLTLRDLHSLLYYAAGITKKKKYPGGEVLYRAASCTGALYEIELYVACGDIEDLPSGVYQYSPRDSSLYRLRQGDYRPVLSAASGREPQLETSEILVISTGTYWRNSWKYQARTYRHFGWDNGTLLANLLTISHALGYPARLVLGFVDSEVNRLLDLDTEREVALSLVGIGRGDAQESSGPTATDSLQLATVPLSDSEVNYPEMHRMHGGTLLKSADEVRRWRDAGTLRRSAAPPEKTVPIARGEGAELSSDNTESVILRRGSSRQFLRESISLSQFSALLHCSSRGIAADFLHPPGSLLNDWYLIVNAVDGLSPGAYVYHPQAHGLELLKEGDFRNTAGGLALGQALAADASFDVFFLADLSEILARYGNRGYRAVQLESGILGGKLYLAAYAQSLGATGLTFFDDDVVDFFSPHAQGKSAIFLMALGKGKKVA